MSTTKSASAAGKATTKVTAASANIRASKETEEQKMQIDQPTTEQLTEDELKQRKQHETDEFQSLYDSAHEIDTIRPKDAITTYKQVIHRDDPYNENSKVKEDAILRVGQLYAQLNDISAFKQFFGEIRPFFNTIAKARTAKIVRQLIEQVDVSNQPQQTTGSGSSKQRAPTVTAEQKQQNLALQAELCNDAIQWCITEKRTFLKQRIQSRLASILLRQRRYPDAIALLSRLVKEVKKFDDKQLLVELFLLESRVHLALKNLPKSKGALTAARANANSIYCPPALQAEIDMAAGVLSSAERDYKTAFSYFYECYEGYNTIKDTNNAIAGLKYMLLTKIMLNQYDDVYSIINGKGGVKYSGIDIEAMKSVADAYKDRSIEKFEAVYKKYPEQLAADDTVRANLDELKDKLLENNLIRLLEPFSRVQIGHVAELISLPRQQVETKLSSMILDARLNGILDAGAGDLILFDENQPDTTFSNSIDTVKELNSVVDRLNRKAKLLAV